MVVPPGERELSETPTAGGVSLKTMKLLPDMRYQGHQQSILTLGLQAVSGPPGCWHYV